MDNHENLASEHERAGESKNRFRTARSRLIPLKIRKPKKRSIKIRIFTAEALPTQLSSPRLSVSRNISRNDLIERINIEEILRDSYRPENNSECFMKKLRLKSPKSDSSFLEFSNPTPLKKKRINIRNKRLNLSKTEECRFSISAVNSPEFPTTLNSGRIKSKIPKLRNKSKSNNSFFKP